MSSSSHLADRVSEARFRRFVGRSAERALFHSALLAEDLPFSLLYLYGPGGIGKTTLLREFARLCREVQTPFLYLDARDLDPSPEPFLEALRHAMGLQPGGPALGVLGSSPSRYVLLLDSYESLAPLDGWVREIFLPQLSENILVVVAGHQPPSPAWRADAGWQTLIRAIPLRNLSPVESMVYLARREVPQEEQRAVLDFTHGHPLALSLVADLFAQRPNVHFQPEAAPDVVKALLGQLVRQVPGPAHRAALESCAIVRLTTEALLSHMLGMPDAHELFDWLRDLSFVESGPQGVFPHDLTREALVADLRWRNPDWYVELHRRARGYYQARLRQARDQEKQRLLFDYVHLHRDNPLVRPFFDWQESGTLAAGPAGDADGPVLVEMVARHEGAESACLLSHWLARQREGIVVLREAGGRPAGFLCTVALQQAALEDRRADPAVRAACAYLESRSPLRPGESASLFRFWMSGEIYQAVSPQQSFAFIQMVRHYLTAPGLAFTFLPCAEPDFWAPVFAYAGLQRIREADFEVGGRRYGVYGHDWRSVPPAAWLEMLAERETDSSPQVAPPSPAAEPLIVLSQPAFDAAVRAALRDLTRPDFLQRSPLARSRLVADRAGSSAGSGQRTAALRDLIQEAAATLKDSPRQAKGYEALLHTYLHPAPTQERAAELLDLPFSTFRRHLKVGIARVSEILWQWEIGGASRPG